MSFSRSARRVTPFDNPLARFLAGRFGVGLFLVSLGMLFAATLIAFIAIRIKLHDLWPTDLPTLPGLLWMSTLVLLVSSGTMHWALTGIRLDHRSRLKVGMLATTSLGLIFLALQCVSWWAWLDVVNDRWGESAEYRFALTNFYVLTGLHALHVVGGLVPLVLVTNGAMKDRYTRDQHPGVVYCAMYWHFLDVVWLVLFTTLLIAG